MELNDKQIKDLVARRHRNTKRKKNIGTSSPALTLAGVVGLQTNIFRYFKRGRIRSFKERVERAYRFNHTL